MRHRIPIAMAGASLLVLALTSAASAQQAPQSAPAAGATTLGEIVITARRRAESLQEVPQVVNAVTADTLQKLNIQEFRDIQSVVPGLTLAQSSTGYQSGASLRGVTFDVNSGAQPTVAMYLNDAPVETNFLFQSLFDVGQIEVLRGPQGTNRGISAPSGAITMTTRKPDLSDIGGYIDATATDIGGRNIQGAINVPIIKDVLAVRAAVLLDQNRFDGVTSIHSNIEPRQVTGAERISLSFEPSDRFNANVAYQHLDRDLTDFYQVAGVGNGTPTDPAIAPDQRVAVQDMPNRIHAHYDVVTAQIDSRIFGQHLSYVGSYQHEHLTTASDQDKGDLLPGLSFTQSNVIGRQATTQEIRIASDPAPGRFFDYTAGAFYQWQSNSVDVTQTTFTSGAFGPPNGPYSAAAFNPKFTAPVMIAGPNTLQETSIFGSVTFHLGANTELTGGVRHIISIDDNATVLTTGPGYTASALPLHIAGFTLNSCLGIFKSSYANECDLPIPANTLVQNLRERNKFTPNIYNVSLSHHFTRDFLAYVNTGTSWRPGPTAVGIFNATNDPALNALTFLQPETSRSYEIGIKSTWFDNRARANLSVFRQRYHNLIVGPGQSVSYVSNSGTGPSVSSANFTANADALVQGVDFDGALQVTREWNIALQASYADGKVAGNSKLPCNIPNGAGGFTYNTDGVISMCPGGSVSRNPLWNASLQTEYVRPVADAVDGFVRGLFTYYPENNRIEPGSGFVAPSYTLANLYAGVRSQDGAWELSLFARNLFNKTATLDLASTPLLLGTLTSGYSQVLQMTPPREIGVHLRYAFGSR
jgi:iron complex outermembrane receptor protein